MMSNKGKPAKGEVLVKDIGYIAADTEGIEGQGQDGTEAVSVWHIIHRHRQQHSHDDIDGDARARPEERGLHPRGKGRARRSVVLETK